MTINKILWITLIIISTINIGIAIPQIPVSSCGSLNQANSIYVLTGNVSSSGTCFTLGANNITLEGQGYVVNYSITSGGYGIVDTGGYGNINIRNLTLIQKNKGVKNSHGIYFRNVANSRVENIIITTQGFTSDGIYLDSSNSNTFNNSNITTANTSGYGIFMYLSNSNYFSAFDITTTGYNGNGIYITSSNYNDYSNFDISTSGVVAHGIYINSGGSNIVKNSSIISKLSNDYYLRNTGTTNRFINTNFTTRKIYFDDTRSSFNYSSKTNDGIWLNTIQIVSPSASLLLKRTLINWAQTNISWQETLTVSRRISYSLGGLVPGSNYIVWNGSVIGYSFVADSNGNLPIFEINFTNSPKIIRILSSDNNPVAPPVPILLATTQGNFWINHSWEAGSGIVTDSYNVSVNGQWRNATTSTYNNSSVLPHGWSNISVWSYNNSGGLSSGPMIRETRLTNNNPVQELIPAQNVDEGKTLTFPLKASDLDSDPLTNSSNNTKGTFDPVTGQFTWTPGYGDAGIYSWSFNTMDSYGGYSSQIITITVNSVANTSKPVSSCGSLNQANSIYVLTRNVSSSGTCFTLGANNITLEGQGYVVNYSITSGGYGIVDTGGYGNINIRNLTLIQKNKGVKNSHGIYFRNVANSRVENIIITTQGFTSDGIYLDSSNSNTFNNYNITTANTSGYGIFMYLSNSNYFSAFDITTTGYNGNGIYLTSSNYNEYSNFDISTSGVVAHGIYINSGGSNIVKNSSIISTLSNDYYLRNTGTTNRFINTNFTTRKIYFDDTRSSFNYSNKTNDGIWLNTTQIVFPSTSLLLKRTLINWSQTNISWQETLTVTRRISYSLGGLVPGSNYIVWNGLVIDYSFVADSNGNLPAFEINLTNSPKMIRVLSSDHNTVAPPVPTLLSTTQGNFWINHSWSAGSGIVTDSYNVSVNGHWRNATTSTYNNSSVLPHGWSNISVWGYNNSGELSSAPAIRETRLTNNNPVQELIPAQNIDEGKTLTFPLKASDLDSDPLTNSSNNTKGTFDPVTGQFTWTPGYGDAGIYTWSFTTTDPYGGYSSHALRVTVTNVPLMITFSSPSNNPTTTIGIPQAFEITLNRTSDVTWYIDGSNVKNDSGLTSSSYTNSTAGPGSHTINATATDGNDTVSREWIWTVTGIQSYIPPVPTLLATTQGNFWINHSWSAGSGIVTDSYNVSVNGHWRNATTSTYNNSSVLPHGWSNISVWSYNNSGELSSAPAIRETRLTNNNPVQTTIGNKVVTAGNVLTFTVWATDADSDTITYSTNAAKGTLNSATGVYSWTTTASDAGTFSWTFNSIDNYGGIASETITVSVTNGQAVWIDLTNNSGELTVNDSSSLGGLSSATWNIWALQSQYTSNAGLFGKYQASSGKRSYLITTSGNEISTLLSSDGINTVTSLSGTGCGLQNNNEWTMITVTYSGSYVSFYRNGQKCGTSKPTSIRSLKNASVPLRIGGGNNIFFKGSIDDTLMYNKELPGSQIYRLLQESEHGLAGRRSIPVILYHQLKNPADESDKVTVNNFEQQIAYLHNNNFTTITPDNFYQWQKDNFTMPERPVIIYFDDGWGDVYDHAFPILNQYGYVGTVAVVAYYADQMPPYGDWTGYLTWDQLRELQDNGWEIASHGFEHLHMTSLSEAEFRYQLSYSREEIENELGRKPTSFVFPYHDDNIPYTTICGEYYDLCWTYGSGDAFPYYSLYTDDGHAYQGLKRITIYNTTTMQTFQNMFAREVYNPVGAWPLNEGTGSIAYDSSGNNNNAIMNANAKWHVNGIRMAIPQLPPSIKPMLLPPTETLS